MQSRNENPARMCSTTCPLVGFALIPLHCQNHVVTSVGGRAHLHVGLGVVKVALRLLAAVHPLQLRSHLCHTLHVITELLL